MGSLKQETDVVVIGGGPGGYVAALRAADLGREVILVEERPQLGGVCLMEGCIPSKSLIHAVQLLQLARDAARIGIEFAPPKVDLDKLRAWVQGVTKGLSGGVAALLDKRGVEVVHGRARFDGPHLLAIEGSDISAIEFQHAIVATGSRINTLPAETTLPLWSSAEALTLPSVPKRLLVVGGGYIGMELGTVYAGLGAEVTMVELAPRLLLGADPDLVDVVVRAAKGRFASILTDSKLAGIEKVGEVFRATIELGGAKEGHEVLEFDQVLVAVGRRPNTDGLGLEAIGIALDERGLIPVNERQQTALPHIYAIGDIVRGPQLAHKASREGKVAAEVIAGEPSAMDNRAVPAVIFTDPEIAWTGLTEREAEEQKRPITVGRFPLRALGRAKTIERTEGFVKVLSDPESKRVLGVGMVGAGVSELIAEGTLAVEMGATLEDLMVTIHPHPTMSEALMEAAEAAAGQAIHIHPSK